MQTIPLIILPPVTEQGTGGNAYRTPAIGSIVYAQMNPPPPAEGRFGITISLPLTLRLS
jgi:hypothetical protein